MKRIWLILFSIILAAGLVFTGCAGDSGGDVVITFHVGDGEFTGNAFATQIPVTIKRGNTVTPPSATYVDHELKGWNTEEDGSGTMLTSSTTHDVDTDYYAIWEDTAFEVTESWDFSEVDAKFMTDDPNASFWDIEGEIITKLRAAEEGSVLRLYFDATGTPNGSNRNNWAIGSIGTATSSADAKVIGLWSPQTAGLVYQIDVELEWCLDLLGVGGTKLTVFVPANNGDKLMKIELLEPMEERVPPVRPTAPPYPPNNVRGLDQEGKADGFIAVIPITFGYFGDVAAGKGEITGDALELILEEIEKVEEPAQVVLRIWTRNTLGNDRSSWADCGQINKVPSLIGGANGLGGLTDPANNRASNIPHTGPNGIINLLGENTGLDLNPYNGQIITLVELWVITPPSANITISGDTDVTQNVLLYVQTGTIKPITNGFEYTGTANHRSSYPWFAVDLGGKRLSSYASIEFDYQLMSDPGTEDRRLALIARTTAFTGSFSSHETGGSGQEYPKGSDNGFLATGQISKPAAAVEVDGKMTVPPIANPETKQKIILLIDPLEALKYNTEVVYLSIYEHSNACTMQITNIKLIEAEGCTLCADVCECDTIISTAKTAVESMNFTGGKVNNSNKAIDAAHYVDDLIISQLPNKTVTTLIETVSFTPWSEGGNGSFVFKVKLNRGAGTEQVTANLTMAIGAFEASVAWDLDKDYLLTDRAKGFAAYAAAEADRAEAKPYDGYGRISSSVSTFAPVHTSSGTVNTHLLVIDRTDVNNPAIISVNGNDTQQFHIIIGTASNGLGLKTADFIYEIKVAGTVIAGGSDARLQLNLNGSMGGAGDFYTAAVLDSSFEITATIPRTGANPELAGDTIRIQPRPTNGAVQVVRIDTIEIRVVGMQPELP